MKAQRGSSGVAILISNLGAI